jgi:hypothetical protein
MNPPSILSGPTDCMPPETTISYPTSGRKFEGFENPPVTKTEKTTTKHLVWQVAMVVNDTRWLDSGVQKYRGSYVNEHTFKKHGDHYVPLSDTKLHDDDALGELLWRCLKPRVADRPTVAELVEETRKGLANALVNQIGQESRLYFRGGEIADLAPGHMRGRFAKEFGPYLRVRYRNPDHPITLPKELWNGKELLIDEEFSKIKSRLKQLGKGQGLAGVNIHEWDNLLEYSRERFREAGGFGESPQGSNSSSSDGDRPTLVDAEAGPWKTNEDLQKLLDQYHNILGVEEDRPQEGAENVADMDRLSDKPKRPSQSPIEETSSSKRRKTYPSGQKVGSKAQEATSIQPPSGKKTTRPAAVKSSRRGVYGSCHRCPAYAAERHHDGRGVVCKGGSISVLENVAREVR